MRPYCNSAVPVHAHVRNFLSRGLCRYGHVVGRWPWVFILLPAVLFGGLGAGLLKLESSADTDEVYNPRDSQSFKDRAKVDNMFPDRTGDHYDALELNEFQIMGSIIFKARNNASVYDDDVIEEIRSIIDVVKQNITIEVDGVSLNFESLCGRRNNECVVTGARLLSQGFNAMRSMSILTYPKWKFPITGDIVDLSFALADSDRNLTRVGVVRVTFKLRHDRKPLVYHWEDAFLNYMATVKGNNTDLVYSASRSFSQVLQDALQQDVFFVWLAIGVTAICTCLLAAWGGDCVSTRALLVPMGVLSPFLGVVGAMGLLSVCGVKVVDMVWVTPLLVLGVGVTDMAVLMSSWSRRLADSEDDDAAQRVGWCAADVGGAISVVSLSLFVTFCVAYTSPFPSVASLGLYAGVAVLFSYISTMTLGLGCLAVHAHRVMDARHVITCRRVDVTTTTTTTKLRDEDQEREAQEKRRAATTACKAMCGGSPPRERYGDQSCLERLPRLLLERLVASAAARAMVGVVYVAVLAASVYGVVGLKQGVVLQSLVADSSYFHDYLELDSRYYGFSFPVVFVLDERMRYNNATATLTARLLDAAKRDPGVKGDFVRCWLTDFLLSPVYNQTTEGEDFPLEVVKTFLNTTDTFVGDVVLSGGGEGGDEEEERISASRCYVFTETSSDQDLLTKLMQRMRGLAESAGLPVFAYHPAFLNFDQRLAVMPTLLKTLGVAVLALLVLYVAVFPELFTTLVVLANLVSTVLGTLGLMHFWDVSVSFMSVTHLLLNAGFALLFSVHVSAAYLQSHLAARGDRVREAAGAAAAPVLTVSLCVTLGVLVFLGTASRSFLLLFKLTLLTLLLAGLHAGFLTPTLLSLVGPNKSSQELSHDAALKADMKLCQRRRKIKAAEASNDVGRDIVSSYFQSDAALAKAGNGSPDSQPLGSSDGGTGLDTLQKQRGGGSGGDTPVAKERNGTRSLARYTNAPTNINNIKDNNNVKKQVSEHGHVSTADYPSGRLSTADYPNGRLSTADYPNGRLSTADYPSERLSAAPPDYPNSVYDDVPPPRGRGGFNAPISTAANYENFAGPFRVPNCDYCKTPRKYSASAASSHYENGWPASYRSVSAAEAGLYDVPMVLSSSRGGGGNKRRASKDSLEADYVNLRAPTSTDDERQKKEPVSVRVSIRSIGKDELMDPPQPPQLKRPKPRSKAKDASRDMDIVASLDKLEEVGAVPVHIRSIPSLEEVHHVACTLSTNGVLGSTQAYVAENFRDILS